MSLGGFITGVASLFGGNDKKQTVNQNTQQNSETATTGVTTGKGKIATVNHSSGTSTTSGTSSQNTTNNTTGKTQNTGKTNTSSVDKSQVAGSEKSIQQGSTTNYSSDILASLDALLTSTLGDGTAQQATDALSQRLTQLQGQASKPAFDVDGYVAGIANAATVATQTDLDSQINTILSATGSSEGGNSMSALLGAKLRNEAAVNLAGITANARATGEQIKMGQQESLTGQISGLSGDISGNLAQLLAAAKGGQQNTTGTAATTSNQTQSGTQVQSGTSSGTQTQNQTTTGSTVGKTQQTTKEQVKEKQQQNETTSQEQTGISQTNTNTKTNQKTKDGKDLFGNILDALGKSSAAA